MNRTSRSEKMLQKWLVFSLCVVVPTLAWGQHKPSGGGGAPKAAPKASAPSHPSTASHGATQSHTSTPSHAATGGTHATTGGTHAATGTHTTTGGTHAATGTHTTTGGTHAATGSRPGAAAGHTTTGSRPGTAAGHTTTGGRPGAAGGRPATASRSNVGSRTPPGRNVSLRGGGSASIRPNGSIRSINRNGMQINHGLHGGRTVVSERNGARIVTRGHGGYVQRAYVTRGGHAYYSRTYFAGGRYHVGLYRGYGWGGHMYYGYYPGVWYHPGFYGWGYQPWGVSVAWGIGAWGWGGAPWWGFYGGWWNPYPVYAAPYYWLTDYLIAANLQAAYAARTEANADAMAADAAASAGDGGGDAAPAASSGPVALTPEVKEAIAQEVKAQLAAQQAQAGQDTGGGQASAAPAPTSDQPPPALDPAQRTFVVDTDVTVVANGQECGLTSGDVITRLTDTPDADQTVNASVSATKKGDCASGQTVAVKVDDLQEMYNHFQENITSGMGELAKKQGTGGMPKAPDTGTQAGAVQPPPPDTSVAKTLQDQQQQADQTESQVKQETASGGGN